MVDARGGVWVAPGAPTGDAAYFDGTTWSVPPSDAAWLYDPARSTPWAGVGDLVAAPDGNVWMAAGGLGLFKGTSWTTASSGGADLSGAVALAAAPDGSIWAVAGTVSLPGDDPGGPHQGIDVVHFTGGAWSVYGAAQGLPAPDPSNGATITAVAASGNTVVATTRDGLYRLAGDRWMRVRLPSAATVICWGITTL